jgi:hypothetical protein
LGHTHEARYQPASLSSDSAGAHTTFEHYLNSGAAGRFENLLWAIEIVDGEECLVSWSRPQPRSGRPERRVYTRQDLPKTGSVLMASASPSALPVPSKEMPIERWLPSILHMMTQ